MTNKKETSKDISHTENFMTEYIDRKLADILFNFLKYTKDYIIKRELDKANIYISHRNIIDILEDSENENNITAINFIEKLGFYVKDLLYFYNLKLDKAGIYFIYSKNYSDIAFMIKQIDLFENVVNSMNEENILFNYKNNLILFINILKLHLGKM